MRKKNTANIVQFYTGKGVPEHKILLFKSYAVSNEKVSALC